MRRSIALLALATVLGGCRAATNADADWPRWGGSRGDFTAATESLADSWDQTPPETLWRRSLGDGYASIVVEGDSIYTLYRENDTDIVVALERKTGDTRWEYRYEA